MKGLVPVTLGAILCASACATTPPPLPTPAAAPAEELAAALPVDPSLTIGRLANGLTYYVLRNAKPEGRAELRLAVDAGSVLEDDDQRGLAHFVEHMAFNGTRRFAKQELVTYLESIGMQFGPDVNAWTSYDETVYTLTVPTSPPELLEKGLEILEDWAGGVAFEEEEVEKERGVVVEEWRLGRGAGERIREQQEPVLLQGSRYAERTPIGEKEVLETAPSEALRRFYRDWYRPDLMAVVAVGDFDPARVEASIRERFGGLRGPEKPRARTVHHLALHQDIRVAVTTDPEVTATAVRLYSLAPRRLERTVGDYRRFLLEDLFEAMLNGRFYERSRDPEQPFQGALLMSGLLTRAEQFTLQQAVAVEERVAPALTALLTETERVRRHGFTATELERAKQEMLRLNEQAFAERDKQESAWLAADCMSHFLRDASIPGVEADTELARRLLPGIALEEVDRLAGEPAGSRVLLVTAPAKSAGSLPSESELLGLFAAARAADLPPWVDRTGEGPLLAETPPAAEIVEEKVFAEVGVTEWRLSNGVRVVMKPTTFKNDEVLFTGFSPGGYSLASDEDLPSALFATTVLGLAGVGRFDPVTLQKALAGKSVSASTYILEFWEGVNGSASPEDLETMFQLAYLAMTAPRKDEAQFATYIDNLRSVVEGRLADPASAFGDEMGKALSQGHPREQPLSTALVARIDLETAYAFYRDRFADTDDFIFILVGSFTPEAVRPLVLTYLGGLPALDREESWRDNGVRPPEGVVRVDVRRGLEPQSFVQMVFTGEAEFSLEGRHDVESLARLLDIRLREVLREDLGAVYGVGVSGNLVSRPRESYTFSIGFGCAPENVDSLVRTVLAEIESIQGGGVAESYLQRIEEIERRQTEINLQTNQYWLGDLDYYIGEGFGPEAVVRYTRLLDRVTAETLQEAARTYLREDRYVLGTLYPEHEAPKN